MESKGTSKPVALPWVRTILHGNAVLFNAKYNKGLSFTLEERRALRIEGLLPPIVLTQEVQVERVMATLRKQPNDLERYRYMMQLYRRNERLFYRVLVDHITDLMPIVYTPTVGLACQEFGHVFKLPAGMYITIRDRGRIPDLLANWPERDVRAIVFTDGERILGLGDLGTYGMGIPIGKLALYAACAGVDPRSCLPVMIDVGTNNKELLEDPMYTGLRQPRASREDYDALIDEFITSVVNWFGSTCLLQFEDFANANAFRLLEKYRDKVLCFNDDISGTASVVLAGIYASLSLTEKKLHEHTFLFAGAGSAGIGIANLIAFAIAKEEKMPIEEARKRIWLVDSQGLVVQGRSRLNDDKLPYAHPGENPVELAKIVEYLKPTALIGVTAMAGTFTEDVCKAMARLNKRPIIFALSNPTSKAECTAEQAYTWTNGQCLYASGSPFDPVTVGDHTHVPGQGNNSYIFPGVAHGVLCVGARRVPDDLFYVAARTLASCVRAETLESGCLYPPLKEIREVSAAIAAAVGEEAYRLGLATVAPKPENMLQFVKEQMFDPAYESYGHI